MNNELLKVIADNQELSKTLQKFLEAEFSLDDFTTNYTNELLGQQVRACLVAKEGIRNAFTQISKYKTVPERPESKNPAR